MKPPFLKIKKGAVVYDDSSQEEPPPRAAPPPGRRSGARRRRGVGSVVFPLLVLAAGLFILFGLGPRSSSRRTLDGWQVTLRATRYEGSLLVGLTFVSTSARTDGASQTTARVFLVGTDEQALIEGTLSKSPMTLWGRFRDPGGRTEVRAEVSIGSAHAVLSLPLRLPGRPAGAGGASRSP
jgi:hypothetical protein